MRNFLLVALAVTMAAGDPEPVYPQGNTARSPEKGRFICSYANKDFGQLASHLTAVQNCAVPLCRNWINIEQRLIYGYAPLNWLWMGSTNSTLTAQQINGFATTAKATALQNQPAGKQLMRIVYFTDIVVDIDSQSGDGSLGANAIYGVCSNTRPNAK